MNFNKALYQKSAYYFGIFFLIALLAFWPNYYGRLFSSIPVHIHLHGVVMTLWCLMLIGQAVLIRLKKKKIHKLVGITSYLLAPMIVISGMNIAHHSLKGVEVHSGSYYSSIALMFNSLLIFAILYGLGMKNRQKPLIHARYMVSTLFPMFTPLTDRLIYTHAREILPFVPTIEGSPMVWLYGFILVDVMLLGLVMIDWRLKKNKHVFPIVLGLLLLYHLSVSVFYSFSMWERMGDWIMSLPLS